MSEGVNELIDDAEDILGVDIPENTEVTPQLRGNGAVFQPRIVTELDLIIPFDIDSVKTQCGGSVVDTDGDFNARVTMEGEIPLSELSSLIALRGDPNNLELTWAGAERTGISNVSFDQIRITRTDEHDTMEYNGRVEPVYAFQLQSKEQDDNGGF